MVAIQEERINQYIFENRELQISNAQQNESFIKETDALKRLNDLHKRYFEESSSKVLDLEKELQVTKDSYMEQYNTMKSNYTQKLNENTEKYNQLKEYSEKMIKELEERLAVLKNNDLSIVSSGSLRPLDTGISSNTALTDHSNLNPSSTSTSSDIAILLYQQNFNTMSVTEMYDTIVKLETELNNCLKSTNFK